MPSFPILSEPSLGIKKGVPLKHILGVEAVTQLAKNLASVDPKFKSKGFIAEGMVGLEELELMDRGRHLARVLERFLPDDYERAVQMICASMTPARETVEDLGIQTFFYLPYSCYFSQYGVTEDRYEISMQGLYELTMRYTAEYAIRPYFLKFQEHTLKKMHDWMHDPNPHVRRLCSEGCRPILPWGLRLPAFLDDPNLTLPLLEALKDDEELYVRRSVANHLGDLAKKNPEWVFELCERWLEGASPERKWVIRHAVRYWAKKEDSHALALRKHAK